jgi:Zn-dependent metalloprotease
MPAFVCTPSEVRATIVAMRFSIVPPYLLIALTRLDDPAMAPVVQAARRSLALDEPFRDLRGGAPRRPNTATGPIPRGDGSPSRARELRGPDRTISDAGGTETLPGTPVRSEGQPPVSDAAVDEAYDGFGLTHDLFREVYERASIDDENLPLDGTVHYGVEYDNAFWDGTRMVFGDGDGMVFRRFTASLSVIGHELTHGVTQSTADLTYRGQSGALNESVSDVFGALVEQRALGQSADEASWLIGQGLFTDEVEGDALRSMIAPGTAYDDDVLGKDPQPASMDDYIVTTDDNGGVHLNSGIPNRAFALAAVALGGPAWESVGRVWYDTLTGGELPSGCTFDQFAAATADAASARFGAGSSEHDAVIEGWSTVGLDAERGSTA